MKLHKLLLLLALPVAIAACEPADTPQADPVLTLTSEASLQYTPEGGQGVITYTLENAVEDTELTATTAADWITDITVGENITFTVAVNETTEARTDRILVAYGNASFNVFIKQATVTVTGDGISTPVTAEEIVVAAVTPELTISKSITPVQVVDNDRVTYTFIIQNTGNEAVVATDNAAVTDTFDPILTDLAVTFNGVNWTQGVHYNYDATTGLFATVPGQILVPAATYTQDPVTGEYTATPGIATLTVTGTI